MPRFPDQVALVTGGATGIGRATSLMFASEGARVAVNYSRSQAEADETVREITGLGGEAFAIRADVSREDEARAMVAAVVERFGRLDALVNNAAITELIRYQDLDAMTNDIWDRILAVNVKGTFFCSREAIKVMRIRGGGQILNVSSISGFTGQGSCIAYAASKAAIINMTQAFAMSEAPAIRVNAVAPGVVQTRWIEGWDEFTEPHRAATPMKRFATPQDIATAIFSLAINRFVTGKTLVVDGGRISGIG
jgi:3-oxoacyl-[acyl-carrier protein] reductase